MIIIDIGTLPYAYYPTEICEVAPAPVGSQQGWPVLWECRPPQYVDATTSEYGGFAAHLAKLRALASDRSLLPEGAAPPSEIARLQAKIILGYLQDQNLEPSRVIASAEGGVVLCFIHGDRYADIECLNSGEVLGVISNRRDRPNVWDVQQNARGITSAAARIRKFIAA